MATCVKCGKWAGVFRDRHDYDCVESSSGVLQDKGRSQIDSPPPLLSQHAGIVMKRYSLAYAHARAINDFGGTVKTLAAVVGILAALLGLRSLVGPEPLSPVSSFAGLAMIILGIVVGIIGWAIGVMIQAGGQVTLAQLDCAVNSSPFLTDEQRATMMSL
jgi:hypothetical protein